VSGGWLPPTEAGAGYVPPAAPPEPPPSLAAPLRAERASYGARVLAALIDFAVRLAIAVPLVLVLAGLVDGTTQVGQGLQDQDLELDNGVVLGLFLGQLAGCVYSVVLLTRWNGQTLGHRAAGTRVVALDGTAMTAGRAAAREVGAKYLLFETVASFMLFIPTVVNYVWPLLDPKDQALHDKLCGTGVLKA
jgi:uncharacterized RDD family membrane protein YckC